MCVICLREPRQNLENSKEPPWYALYGGGGTTAVTRDRIPSQSMKILSLNHWVAVYQSNQKSFRGKKEMAKAHSPQMLKAGQDGGHCTTAGLLPVHLSSSVTSPPQEEEWSICPQKGVRDQNTRASILQEKPKGRGDKPPEFLIPL